MNDYKPSARPVAFGAVAIALTAMTIGLAVVLPANIDSSNREIRTVAAPPAEVTPAADVDSGPLRIEVIAERDAPWTPVHTRLTAPKSRRPVSGQAGAHAVAGPEPLGHADAGVQRAFCPYLTKGTVAATS